MNVATLFINLVKLKMLSLMINLELYSFRAGSNPLILSKGKKVLTFCKLRKLLYMRLRASFCIRNIVKIKIKCPF